MADKNRIDIVGFILTLLWVCLITSHLHLINASISKLERQMQSYDTVTSRTLPITWGLILRERG